MKLIRCMSGHIYDSETYIDACPYCSSKEKDKEINLNQEIEKESKTVGYWIKELSVDPVVGWLVCIEGADKGKDYRIINERNFIGRSSDMEICITGDSSISRKNHCSIVYNPKQRIFVITPGDSNGLVYVQMKALYESKEINNFDLIEIGNSKFIFIKLCGENFDWNG